MKKKKSTSKKGPKKAGTCGSDPSESLFPENAPKGCVLVRAHYRRIKGKRKR